MYDKADFFAPPPPPKKIKCLIAKFTTFVKLILKKVYIWRNGLLFTIRFFLEKEIVFSKLESNLDDFSFQSAIKNLVNF